MGVFVPISPAAMQQVSHPPGLIDPKYMPFLLTLMFVLVAIFATLLIAALTVIKYLKRRIGTTVARGKDCLEKFQPGGKPYPPIGEGICDNCMKTFDKVYYQENGKRFCPACYRTMIEGENNNRSPADTEVR